MKKHCQSKINNAFVPQTGLEPVRPNGHRILSPACLPIPPPGCEVERKRDSNPRPQPWQGCALPAELFSHSADEGTRTPRLTAPDPKSGVATNYTTSALFKELLYRFCECKYRDNLYSLQIFFKIFHFLKSTKFHFRSSLFIPILLPLQFVKILKWN